MKTVVLHPQAARALDRLPVEVRQPIVDALIRYATTGEGDTKAMVRTPTVRLRVGDFRAIFDETANEIIVLALGHRRDIYR